MYITLYIKLFIDNEIKTCNEDLKNVNNINEIDKLQNKYNLKIEENIKDLYDEIRTKNFFKHSPIYSQNFTLNYIDIDMTS